MHWRYIDIMPKNTEMVDFLEDIMNRFYPTLTDIQRKDNAFMQDYYMDTEDVKKIIRGKIDQLKK